MKSLIITGLSSLVLGGFFPPVSATEMMAMNSTIEENKPSPNPLLGGGTKGGG